MEQDQALGNALGAEGSPAGMALAAIVQPDSGAADPLLAAAVTAAEQRGLRVRGLLTEYPGAGAKPLLRDIATGAIYPILQGRGKGAGGCCLDTQVLSEASQVLRAALADAPDLVVVNRYGTAEAEGSGFTAELLALVEAGIPVLLAVNERYLDAWRHFHGGLGQELPCAKAAVDGWLDAQFGTEAP